MKYYDELTRAMAWLAEKEESFFLGQAVGYPGTGIYNTLKEVPDDKRMEFPVNEDLQMGVTVGMALRGTIPVSIYPRWNFLLLATNQLVNHLDKASLMSHGDFQPKAIIRVSIGSQRPLHPQHQHIGDYTEGFRLLAPNIDFIRLDEPHQIFPAYKKAYEREDGKSTVLIEWGDFYNEK